jgi:hypothetical protein
MKNIIIVGLALMTGCVGVAPHRSSCDEGRAKLEPALKNYCVMHYSPELIRELISELPLLDSNSSHGRTSLRLWPIQLRDAPGAIQWEQVKQADRVLLWYVGEEDNYAGFRIAGVYWNGAEDGVVFQAVLYFQ